MSYEHYVIGKPDPTTGNGATFAAELKVNLEALHHAVVTGLMPGWNFLIIVGTGTVNQPQFNVYVRGSHGLELSITWNASGNPSSILYRYTSNGGTTFVVVGTVTYSYDSDQNVTGYTWS